MTVLETKIIWVDASQCMPDDGLAVVVNSPFERETVWIAYWDSHYNCWRWPSGTKILTPVEFWAVLPEPPSQL